MHKIKVSDFFQSSSEETPPCVIPGENRRIAVLSMDILGFENMIMDTEGNSMEGLLSLIISEISSCVTAFEGHTSKVKHNRIVAMFGAVQSTEHACRRAIDCSFKILRILDMIGENDEGEGLLKLTYSAGIGCNSAIVTHDSAGKPDVYGDCMEEADALRRIAPTGTILVSERSMNICKSFFSWKLFEDTGNEKVWIPLQERESSPVHPLIDEIPLIGREKEMEKLTSAYNSYLQYDTHNAMFISGESGCGKSCFIEHFLSTIHSENVQIIRLKNKQWDQPPLGTWLPLMKKGTFDPYSKVMTEISRICSEGNFILVIEDIHWADSASLKLLDQLSNTFIDAGVFLIVSSRKNPQGYLMEYSDRIKMKGLNKESVILLIEVILGVSEDSGNHQFADFLMKNSKGNPLLLTELIMHSIATGVIGRNRNDTWFINKKLNSFGSETAKSFMHARLSVLKKDELFALQVAAILGDIFQEDIFRDVFSKLGKNPANILSKLLNMGFLTTDRNDNFHFSNSLMAESVYKTILQKNKVLIHRKAAEVLSSDLNPRDEKYASFALSRHWIESGSGAEAIPWLLTALEQNMKVADINRAEILSNEIQKRILKSSEYYSKYKFFLMRLYMLMGKFQLALNTAEEIEKSSQNTNPIQVRITRAQARENLGMPLQDVLDDYMLAVKTAKDANNINAYASCLGAVGAVLLALGKGDEALKTLNQALVHEDSLETMAKARLHGNMGILQQRTGNLSEAIVHYSKTYQLGKQCGDRSVEANAIAYIGHVEISMGKKDEGIKKCREALAIHRSTGNIRGECIILGNLGGTMARFGETENAIEALTKAIQLAGEIGHTRGAISFHANLGLAYKKAERYDIAEKHIRKAMTMLEKIGDKVAYATCHLNLAGIFEKSLRTQEAIAEARAALRCACTVDSPVLQANALSCIGSIMMQTGREEMALNFYKEAYKRSNMTKNYCALAGYRIGESKCLLKLNRYEDALKKYAAAVEFKEKYGIDHEGEMELQELKDTFETSTKIPAKHKTEI